MNQHYLFKWWGWILLGVAATMTIMDLCPTISDLPFLVQGPNNTCVSRSPVLIAPISPITDIAVDGQSIYMLTRATPGSVSRLVRNSGDFKILVDLAAEPYGILVDDESVYWVEGTWQPAPDFSLKKMDKNGGDVFELWHDQGLISQLTMDKNYIYWLDYEMSGIWRISKKNGLVEKLGAELQDFSSLSVLNGTFYLGGSGGLRRLESPDEEPETLITTDQLLQDLRIGVRDEHSTFFTGPVLAVPEQTIIFDFYVANYPGMISCTDNADHIVSLPLGTGSPRIIASVQGSMGPARIYYPYLYMVGACTGGSTVNLQTGKTLPLELSYDVFSLAVDKNFIFWSDQEGLKCMLRPGE